MEQRKRNTIEKKYEKVDSQVKLAKERSLSHIELIAEKRKLLKELNEESNSITKA